MKIEHHQTSFTTNAKRTSIGWKHREGKHLQKPTKKTKKMPTGTFISIITLNINGLNSPTKRQTG